MSGGGFYFQNEPMVFSDELIRFSDIFSGVFEYRWPEFCCRECALERGRAIVAALEDGHVYTRDEALQR